MGITQTLLLEAFSDLADGLQSKNTICVGNYCTQSKLEPSYEHHLIWKSCWTPVCVNKFK